MLERLDVISAEVVVVELMFGGVTEELLQAITVQTEVQLKRNSTHLAAAVGSIQTVTVVVCVVSVVAKRDHLVRTSHQIHGNLAISAS